MAKELGLLIHYGATELKPVAKIENNNFVKPKGGLWTSPVESNWAWKHWCESEQFRDCNDENSFTISLKSSARILKINTVADLLKLPKKILIESIVYPDFEMIAESYDAIWLTEKGQWETRYSHPMSLYGWDCESVLILNDGCIANVICSTRERNHNFKKEVFEKKVQQHIKCGYSRDLAEWKVLGDFNRLFFKAFGTKPNKRQTDINGYYI